jgi:CheY-like chemotaxis protein/HPt (histidine-containing phosphotransfer) domain-containing protein
MVDPMRLQQILNNLVSNAIKFTARGYVEVRADLEERRDGIEQVTIRVTDTGIGIADGVQATLFEPFTQASGDVARVFGGTGLGLSIARRLAELMGGTIAIASMPGRGTVVTVALPLAIADPAGLPEPVEAVATGPMDSALLSRRAPPQVDRAEAEGTLVLVVDDHPVNRMLLTRQVAVLGYAHEAAANGREALERWSSRRFGLVLTDCNMPELDGYDLTREIRAREKARGLRPTVIIACTANALAGEAENCFAAGMNDYIAKPVDLGRLAAKLDRWLPLPAPAANDEVGSDPVDRSVLREIAGGDVELERVVLEQFTRVSLEDVAVLETAIDSRDATQVTQTAHRIKGASRAVGASALAEASARIEGAARAGDWEEVFDNRASLIREVKRLNGHLASPRAAAGGRRA